MKKALIFIAGLLLTISIILGTSFGSSYMELIHYRFFAPKKEAVRREVFENTPSFIAGKKQAITKYYNEYRKSSQSDKEALREVVLQEFADFNMDHFSEQQIQWYNEIVGYNTGF